MSTSLIKITEKAMQRFSPDDRKCWDKGEIKLEHLPYDEDYRYGMSNCLYEAAMQEAAGRCGCYPGHRDFYISFSVYLCSGYVWKSETPCQGKALNCFEQVFYYLGK